MVGMQTLGIVKDERTAAESVTAAAPPRLRDRLLTLKVTHPMFLARAVTADEGEHVALVVLEGMLCGVEGHTAWWEASGDTVTAMLCEVSDLDYATASHMVGAAAVARSLAGLDRGEDAVLRLAERAACWLAGVRATA